MFGLSTHRLTHLMAPYTNIFYYEFGFVGRHSVFNFPDNRPFGVAHADELHCKSYEKLLGHIK
jgi:hypothetical protein